MFQDFLSGKWLQILMQNIKVGSYSKRDWSQTNVGNWGFVFCKWRLQVATTNQTSCVMQGYLKVVTVYVCSCTWHTILIIVDIVDVFAIHIIRIQKQRTTRLRWLTFHAIKKSDLGFDSQKIPSLWEDQWAEKSHTIKQSIYRAAEHFKPFGFARIAGEMKNLPRQGSCTAEKPLGPPSPKRAKDGSKDSCSWGSLVMPRL